MNFKAALSTIFAASLLSGCSLIGSNDEPAPYTVLVPSASDSPADRCVIEDVNLEAGKAIYEGSLGFGYDLDDLKVHCEEKTNTAVKTTKDMSDVVLMF